MRTTRVLAALWLLFFIFVFIQPISAQEPTPSADASMLDDALIAPPPPPSLDSGVSAYGPSAYLAGRVAVRVILPESNGSIDQSTEDWTAEQVELIRSQIKSALDWWAARVPGARVSFELRVEVVPTAYEPINYGLSNEGLWIGDTLTHLGYTGSSYFDQAYMAANALRDELNTDWATTIFIANNARRGNAYFSDGHFAYAYVNGPFMVLTSGVGGYGPNRMAQVAAHELGHIFGALDQYSAARVACTQRSGYLYTPTTNSQYNSCGTKLPSIMHDPLGAFQTGSVDPSALAQLGYRDSDNDGLIDPLDTQPTIELVETTLASPTGRPFFKGRAYDVGFPAPYQQVVSINRISRVEYRVNNGLWQPTLASDGTFDSTDEIFQVELPLYNGSYEVELRAVNSVGVASPSTFRHLDIDWIGPQPNYSISGPEISAHPEIKLSLNAPAVTRFVQISESLSFENAPWQPYSANLSYTLSNGDGTRPVYVRFRDHVDLVSLAYSIQIQLDTQPPAGHALRDANNTQRLFVEAYDTGAGVSEVGLQIGNNPIYWTSYQREIDLPGLFGNADNASLTANDLLYVSFRDAAGNTSAPAPVGTSYNVSLPMLRQ